MQSSQNPTSQNSTNPNSTIENSITPYSTTREVVILTTGGTIEKNYFEEDGSLKNTRSLLETHLLSTLRLPTTKLSIQELMAKDSLEMNEHDREMIFKAVMRNLARAIPIIILHGTDTMEISAEYIEKNLPPGELKSPIVFTGAMRPATMRDSDAQQNFTEALTAAQLIPPGVYISFHNQILRVPGATKNRQTGTFVEKTNSADIRFKNF